jgi:CAAX protease family protein
VDATTALTYAFLVLAALVCQLAERGGGSRSGQATAGLSLRDTSRALVAFVVVYAMLAGAAEIVDRGAGGSVGDGILEIVAGSLALLLMVTGWQRIPGLRGLRPRAPISWLALSLYLLTLAHNLAPASGRATVAATSAAPQSTAQLVVGALPFAALGVAAVGPRVRRPLPEALRRLGLLPLRPWAWVLGLALGVAAVKAGGHVYDLVNLLTPADCRSQQQRVFEHLAGPQRAWWQQLAVAGAAGVGEELLFRGALQPRFGIVLASVLWASLHLQYTCHGLPSASNLYILLLGLLFGVFRRWWGLGAAITAHVAYDATILLFGA